MWSVKMHQTKKDFKFRCQWQINGTLWWIQIPWNALRFSWKVLIQIRRRKFNFWIKGNGYLSEIFILAWILTTFLFMFFLILYQYIDFLRLKCTTYCLFLISYKRKFITMLRFTKKCLCLSFMNSKQIEMEVHSVYVTSRSAVRSSTFYYGSVW